jgi:predicted DCC family thiol-disulfide oxidoreductase YuxK
VLTRRPVLLFDGGCGFCREWVRRLQRWDRSQAIEYVPSQQRAGLDWLPPLSDAALDRAMHLVLPDGSVYPGARALPALLPLLPAGAPLGLLLRIPGVQAIADRLYAWIAGRRHRLGCGAGKCGI